MNYEDKLRAPQEESPGLPTEAREIMDKLSKEIAAEEEKKIQGRIAKAVKEATAELEGRLEALKNKPCPGCGKPEAQYCYDCMKHRT